MTAELDVMTYNIRLGVESSLAAVAAAVGPAPDLLALQEVGDRWNMGEPVDQARVIADHLGLLHAVFAGALTDVDGGRYGIALCARHPLVDVRVTPLPRIADEQRVMLEARLLHPLGSVAVVSTHLSIGAEERMLQARRVGEAAGRTGPVVVLGDLNDRPGTEVVTAARGPLTDAFDAAGAGRPETFSVADPHRRIDYIFCGGPLRPRSAVVDRSATASDHFPLRATLTWA